MPLDPVPPPGGLGAGVGAGVGAGAGAGVGVGVGVGAGVVAAGTTVRLPAEAAPPEVSTTS